MKKQKNILHFYMDLLRNKTYSSCGHAIHNIINTMSCSRDTYIYGHEGEDFTGIDFGAVPMNGLHFSSETDQVRCFFCNTILHDANFRSGHSNNVSIVEWTYDGSRIITCSWDCTAIVWEASSGLMLHRLDAHTADINCISLSKNNKICVTGSNDSTAIIWDLNTGKINYVLSEHKNSIRSIAISNDSLLTATASDDLFVKIWDVHSGLCKHTLVGHEKYISGICFIDNDQTLVSTSVDGIIKMWDVSSGKCKKTIYAHSDSINVLTYSETSNLFATGSSDKRVYIWNAVTGAKICSILYHKNSIECLTFSHDGTKLITGSHDNTSVVWNIETNMHLELIGHKSTITSVGFSHDDDKCITCSWDGTSRIWNTENGQVTNILIGCWPFSSSNVFSPIANQCIIPIYKTAVLWNSVNGKEILTLPTAISRVRSVAFDINKKYYLTGLDSTALLWDTQTGCVKCTYEGHNDFIASAAISSDSKYVVTGSYDATVRIWDFNSGTCLETIDGFEDVVGAVAISQDGKYCLVGGASCNDDYKPIAKICELATGKCIHTFVMQSDPHHAVNFVAFSYDCKKCMVGFDNKAIIIDCVSGKTMSELELSSGCIITAFAFSPSGRYCILCDVSGSIALYETFTSNFIRLYEIKSNHDMISSVLISDDESMFITGHENAAIDNAAVAEVRNLANGELIRTLGLSLQQGYRVRWRFPYCSQERIGKSLTWKIDCFSNETDENLLFENLGIFYTVEGMHIENCPFDNINASKEVKTILRQYNADLRL